MLLLAIAACIGLTGYRWTRRGGDWDLVLRAAVWGVAAGIVGARALPRHHELERGPDARSGRASSRSGRAASASGAGSSSAASPARRRPPLGRERARCSWTPSRRASCSRRRSAAGATGGTRSCSASRRPAVGPEDRRRPPAVAGTQTRATVPPDLPLRVRLRPRRRRACCSCSTGASGSGRRRCSRSTSPTTRSAASSRSCCASTRRTTSSGCG